MAESTVSAPNINFLRHNSSFTQPTDGIRHRQNNTTVYVNDNNLGKGTLYIAESRLSWVSDSGSGFSIEYPHISLHAVSRDLSAFPQECLFLMLDTALGDENEKNGDGEDEGENENGSDEQETTELRLVPDDRGMLDAMFHAMNACQALHPDPEDSFSDEDFFEDADDEIPMEEADSQMANLSIENMGNRGYILGNETGRVVGRVVDRVVDRAVDRAVDRVVDRGVGNEVDMGVDVEEGMEEDMAVGNILGNNISGVGAVDRGVGMEEGMEEDTAAVSTSGNCILGEGREVGTGVGMGVGRVSGRLDIGVGTGVGMAADREEGRGEACTGVGMAQGDRSFSSGSIWHQGRTVRLPPANPHQTDPEEESNFADAEN